MSDAYSIPSHIRVAKIKAETSETEWDLYVRLVLRYAPCVVEMERGNDNPRNTPDRVYVGGLIGDHPPVNFFVSRP